MNFKIPPKRTMMPIANNAIATGRNLTGRGAGGSASGIGGGGGGWKSSLEALIDSFS
jgi:hypothetical protein